MVWYLSKRHFSPQVIRLSRWHSANVLMLSPCQFKKDLPAVVLLKRAPSFEIRFLALTGKYNSLELLNFCKHHIKSNKKFCSDGGCGKEGVCSQYLWVRSLFAYILLPSTYFVNEKYAIGVCIQIGKKEGMYLSGELWGERVMKGISVFGRNKWIATKTCTGKEILHFRVGQGRAPCFH